MRTLYILSALFILLGLSSCEQSIDVPLDTAAPRLVVDAVLNWQKGTAGNEQTIKLSLTGNYYNVQQPPVSGATVEITNSVGTVFNFVENPGTGTYVCSTFVPEIGESYTLHVDYNGQQITATETLRACPPIDYIAQETIAGIAEEEDQIEVKAYFTDPGNTVDYYLFRFQSAVTAVPEYAAVDDEFFQGNQVFALYLNDEMRPGQPLKIRISGISERFFNYMEKLNNIVGGNGPFNTPGGVLRGNLVNTTQPDNYVLGYFSVAESDEWHYTIGPY